MPIMDINWPLNGTTYSKYYTNSTIHLGNDGSDAAVRLRWGGTEGTYIDFITRIAQNVVAILVLVLKPDRWF
jgi:hypothetical protein